MRNPPILLIVLPIVALFCLGLLASFDGPGCLAVEPGIFPVDREARAVLVGCWFAKELQAQGSGRQNARLVSVSQVDDSWLLRYHGEFQPASDPIIDEWPIFPWIELEISESGFVEVFWEIDP